MPSNKELSACRREDLRRLMCHRLGGVDSLDSVDSVDSVGLLHQSTPEGPRRVPPGRALEAG